MSAGNVYCEPFYTVRMEILTYFLQISDIATSSVMELYGYKMTCLEQRLHSHSVALQVQFVQFSSKSKVEPLFLEFGVKTCTIRNLILLKTYM